MMLIPLRSDIPPTFRADVALEGLDLILDELTALAHNAVLSPEHVARIDMADTRLAMLRAARPMRKSLASLCGVFGRHKPEQNQGAAP